MHMGRKPLKRFIPVPFLAAGFLGFLHPTPALAASSNQGSVGQRLRPAAFLDRLLLGEPCMGEGTRE